MTSAIQWQSKICHFPSTQLEAHHGADLGFAYDTPDSAKGFTTYIAKSQRQAFLNKLSVSETHFFSFLTDGTTDAGNKEEELFTV